jgi:hypothetical protein
MRADRWAKDWVEIIERKSLDVFAAAFTEDAVLDAPVFHDSIGAKWYQERLLRDCPRVRNHRVHAPDGARVKDLSGMARPSGASRRPA